MSTPKLPSNFYLSLVKFILQAKHEVVAIGAELGLSSMQAMTKIGRAHV